MGRSPELGPVGLGSWAAATEVLESGTAPYSVAVTLAGPEAGIGLVVGIALVVGTGLVGSSTPSLGMALGHRGRPRPAWTGVAAPW